MKFLKTATKVILAGIIAICILSVLLLCYSCIPLHAENRFKNTDYAWAPNSHWAKMTEGVSFGKFDSNGFNNISTIDNPDIIFLGSSHMEATNVMQDESAPHVLGEKLKGKLSVYNMSVSGHELLKICGYLPATLEAFDKSPDFIIIETSTVRILEEDVDKMVAEGETYNYAPASPYINALQQIPFLRLMYHQYDGGLKQLLIPELKHSSPDLDKNVYPDAYDKLTKHIADIEGKYDTKIIVVCHPFEKIDKDGSISYKYEDIRAAFKTAAEKNGVTYIDMADSFTDMYLSEHHLPHGFATGYIGDGHLNKYGHAKIADVLYETIIHIEKDGGEF